MEVVPGLVHMQPCSRRIGVGRVGVAHGWIDVVQGSPFEQDFARLDVDFLEYTLHQPAHARLDVPGRHVELSLLVDGHQGCFAVVDREELVHVTGRHSAAWEDGSHRAV